MTYPTINNKKVDPLRSITNHFIVFDLDKYDCALPLACIERAVRMVAVTPVPDSPSWLDGVVNISGKTMPVVDLLARLGQPPMPLSIDDRLLVLTDFVLRVSDGRDVLEITSSQLDPIKDELREGLPVEAVIRLDDRMILLLDHRKLCQIPEDILSEVALPNIIANLEAPPMEDDLTVIKGLGPVYAQRLQSHGIRSYKSLARTSPEELEAYLGEIKGRPPQVRQWQSQAFDLLRAKDI